MTVWPAGQERPKASNLNVERVGQTVPNLVVVPVGAGGVVDLFTQSGTHLIADVAGWFGTGVSGVDPATLVIAKPGEASLSGDLKTARVTVTYSGPDVLTVDKIVVVPPDETRADGFYGRVVEVTGPGVAVVDPVQLGDIVPSASFGFDVADPSVPAAAVVRYSNLPLNLAGSTEASSGRGPRYATVGSKFTFTCDGSVNYDVDLSGTRAFLRNTKFDFGWSVGVSGVTVNRAAISAEVGITLSLAAQVSAQTACNGSKQFLHFDWSQTFSIGPVPVWIDHSVSVDLKYSLSAQGHAAWSVIREFGARVGAEYDGSGFRAINSPIDTPAVVNFDGDASVHMDIRLPIAYDARLYGVTGLGATLEPWVSAEANATVSPAGANASVGVWLGVPLTVRGTLRIKADLPWIGSIGFERSFDFARFDIVGTRQIFSRTWSWTPTSSTPLSTTAVAPKPNAVPSTPLPSSGGTYHVTNTGGVGVRLRNSPRLDDIMSTGPNDGAAVSILCQMWGDAAGPRNNHVWDAIAWNGTQGFIPDAYTDTPVVADQFVAGIGRCTDPGVTQAPPAATTTGVYYATTNTGGLPTFVADAPSLGAARRTGPSEGDRWELVCQSWGDAYGAFGNHLWDHIRWAGGEGFLPDTYSTTPTVANQFVGTVPHCPGGDPPTAPSTTPPSATTYVETQGHHGVNTFSDHHSISGQGPSIAPFQTVHVSCKVLDPSAASISPDGYWYLVADSPWNNGYWAAANTFFNGDPVNGPYTHNTDFAVPDCGGSAPPPPPVPTTRAETVGGVTHTWTNYLSAGGTQGSSIASFQTVQVACKITGFRVADGDTWWYRIASSPWNNTFYASADAFYNNGATSGSLIGTPFFDPAVPNC